MRSKRPAIDIPRATVEPHPTEAEERIRDGFEQPGLAGDPPDRLSFGAEEAAREELSRNLAEIQELERLMESFVGELSKLDESLEVLSAYLRRMRSSTGGPGRRVLH